MPMLPSKMAPFSVTSSFSRGREKTIRKRKVSEEKSSEVKITPREKRPHAAGREKNETKMG